jgi:iron complex transport system permease protein
MNRWLLYFLILCFILVCFGTLVQGTTDWSTVCLGVSERLIGNSIGWNPLLDERIPRLIVLLSTGASLAVAGAVMQALFRNPLASPGVLGINSGGGLCALVVFASALHTIFPFSLPLAAFIGCLLTLLAVYALSYYIDRAAGHTLIFVGLSVATVFVALQGALTYYFRDNWALLQGMIEWQGGATFDRSWMHVHMQMPLTLIGLGGILVYLKEINIFTLGEEDALNLGVDVTKVRWRLFLFVSMLSGGAMAALGSVPFFGLVLPHIMRKLLGPNNYRLIPITALAGAVSLAGLDLTLRVFHVAAFSIGDVCSIVGGIFFLLLLVRRPKSWRESYART